MIAHLMLSLNAFTNFTATSTAAKEITKSVLQPFNLPEQVEVKQHGAVIESSNFI